MKTRKRPSDVSDLLELAETVYKDATAKCVADVFDLRDLQTVRSRVEHEGLSFLTIALPQFARDFERSIARGYIAPTDFLNFEKLHSFKGERVSATIPTFLRGLVTQVFDIKTGKVVKDGELFDRELSDDIPTCVESVRQICLTFKKLELDCTRKRTQAAFDSFVSIEQSFDSFSVPASDISKFLAVSDLLWGNLVSSFKLAECIPSHGPGATVEGITGNGKFQWQYWYDRLEPYFPLVDNGLPLGIPEDSEELKSVTIVSDQQELPVRVVAVPKTLKGPRIIAIEPCCMQYVQQGIRDYLYRALESYELSAGQVNFRDQTVNQKLALDGSISSQLATIDLSDASDRVPRDLALGMFRCNPDFADGIDACRSNVALLPDGRLVGPLRKFASMGSALCFPIEAMYFYTLCVMALLDAENLSLSLENLHQVTRVIYVYGDDIVVPTTNATAVLDYLQKYNCKVNVNKTFCSGSFRESCGVDAYAGYEVTPTYLRRMRPTNRHQASQIISWVATRNLFYKKGYWKTARLMQDMLEKVTGRLPYASETSEHLGCISFLEPQFSLLADKIVPVRWSEDYQRFEIKALVPKPVYRTDVLDGYSALMASFLHMSSQCYDDVLEVLSLEKTALHDAVTLKRRWVGPS